ncbi:E3 ubiquitin-protein ligase BRE1-like 1 isoform X2 [Carya illinoinensis]|uniref:E3 ubiquitin-protein ligase BRE1-like 1 isoform X2 n=1 Tax=Carya illinoinensis TaxID=32201 RepID=UPI001C71E724|nr:E3 ubiquitin-protein ligase BRE1-like 1 isoform X2 [Carya illinoinensis]
MGSTGESDRKRRHFGSISPTAAATPKKQPFLPISEDKKLDVTVLQYQNQKLVQKLEAQKVESFSLENKLSLLNQKQQPYDSTLAVVNKSLDKLVNDLDSFSIKTRESSSEQDGKHLPVIDDGVPSTFKDAFLSRLTETGATEHSSTYNRANHVKEDSETATEKTENILRNIVAAVDNLWYLKDGLLAAVLKELPDDGACRQKTSHDLEKEVKNLRMEFSDLHLKHKSLARELQRQQNVHAKNEAEMKHLREELEVALSELEENNCNLASLKAQRNAAKGAFFPILNLGNNQGAGDRVRDTQKDLHDMESTLKELTDQASCRLTELKGLHDERIEILQHLSSLQNMLKNVKCISSSNAYVLVRDQTEKSKSEVLQYQALYEKLQVEKDNILWRERELNIKNDIADVFRRSSAVADFRAADLGIEIQKQIEEINMIESKLKEASREPGRKEIIAEFKTLLSSFPEDMSIMQSELSKYKEAASDVHSLRADVQSLSCILERKVKECETSSARSAGQVAEMQKLQALVQDLKESDRELKLILEMYRHESTDSRDVMEARDLEYKAWSHVQTLKSSLDEHNLELRVKTANEAEAISQQTLAAAEAEIAELRQKLETSKRDISRLTDVLKSKNEENEAYLSEIESIGQAYDDMQNQNQHLLQQITERDDYNIKLVLEGVRTRQLQDTLIMEKRTMEREVQQANASLCFFDMKASRIEDQLKICSEQIQKLVDDKLHGSFTLESTQKKLLDVRRSFQQAQESLEESQSKVEKSRVALVELQIELERESVWVVISFSFLVRFDQKRIEEELEVVRRKASRLRAETEGSSIVEKLQEELREYRDILKCSICLDRTKEVVITKCYHLFCNPCVQRIIGTRHRKCPTCATSFGSNDVKPVYI